MLPSKMKEWKKKKDLLREYKWKRISNSSTKQIFFFYFEGKDLTLPWLSIAESSFFEAITTKLNL